MISVLARLRQYFKDYGYWNGGIRCIRICHILPLEVYSPWPDRFFVAGFKDSTTLDQHPRESGDIKGRVSTDIGNMELWARG